MHDILDLIYKRIKHHKKEHDIEIMVQDICITNNNQENAQNVY
jgi:hypothetical protein